jgi:hypothetical protein
MEGCCEHGKEADSLIDLVKYSSVFKVCSC